MAKLKNPNTGRPPRFKKKEELQKKIDDYFQECEGTLLLDKEGRPVYTEKGALVYLTAPKPPEAARSGLFYCRKEAAL